MNTIRPPQPPAIRARDVIAEIDTQNIVLPRNVLSIMASKSWSQEGENIKEIYRFLANEAETLFKYLQKY
ncbi:16038_t:CDS:2 [Cetraspora pellucida]|uniref:16038_t:CDS:1 n=1 Tax=Cetraspora pellucida TaxID=1433469 RepID=A0A9N9I959_9GLOM|nr:16038_t:CDS:2 [Cetraspora pellucida]